jgi:hypothetical protein
MHINFMLLLYCPFIFSWKDDEPSVPACEGVEAGLPQGEAAGVLLLLGLRLPLLNINKLFQTFMSFSYFIARTVILFSSRYLFPAKSICPTCEQAIQIFMQIRAAAPPNRKLQHIFV